ncbi:MAG TPA: lipoprotein-releasing system ATP-binding protein LolD [Alphaproteobacteria bacterium]|nr:lipoprotein-releasing system ATP-binding protein LolD [Alphaproteobacteria bacterium]
MSVILKTTNLNKSFDQGKEKLHVLKDISLEINSGEMIALIGYSGSGKSTLLQIVSGLMDFDSGNLEIFNHDIRNISDAKRTEIRNKYLGFVYQYHHLLADFTALQNVMMPMLISGVDKKLAEISAYEVLVKVGLQDRVKHKPFQLSGGQQQRVAIARALANKTKLIIADEPTGNLDSENSANIIELFWGLVRENNSTLVIATHNKEISDRASRVITIKDGRLI